MYSAGTAFLTVVPEFEGIENAFKEQAEKLGEQVDRSISRAIPNAVRNGMQRAERDMDRHGSRAGERFAGAFNNTLTRRLTSMANQIRDIEIDADTSPADRAIADLKKEIVELRDVVINAEVDDEFALLEMRRIQQKARELSRESITIEAHFNLAQVIAEAEAVEQAIQNTESAQDKAHREALAQDRERTVQRQRNLDTFNQGLEQYAREHRRTMDAAYDEDERRERDRARMLSDAYDENERRDRDRINRLRELQSGLERFAADQRRLEREAHEENERFDRDRINRLRELQNGLERFAADQRRLEREAHEENQRFDRQRIEAARELARIQGGAFGEQGRRRTSAARDVLPDLDPGQRSRPAQDDIARVRNNLDRLSRLTVDVDIPPAQYLGEVAALEATLQRIEEDPLTLDIDRSNIRLARAELQALTRSAGQQGDEAGEDWGGSFLRNVRRLVREAEATISDIELGLDTTQAQFDIQEMKARLAVLSNVRIGVDMSLEEFVRETTYIDARLAELEGDHVDIQTRLEAAATRAALTLLHQQINAVDRDDIEIDVDLNGGAAAVGLMGLQAGIALSRLQALIAVSLTLGTAIVPAAAVAAAALSSIATAAGAAAAGVGVLALGLFGPLKAVQALNQYQKDTAKSAKSLATNQNQIANALDGVTSAERSVEKARESAARGARQAAKQVQSASRAVVDAEKDQEKAHKELVKAIREAQQAEEDRAFSQRSNALSQRQANLDLKEAKAELDKILANPRATEDEREQAKITYEQRKLQLEELGVAGKRLEEERLRVAKEGADGVVAAQERVAASNRAVADAQERYAEAVEAQTQQRIDGQQAVADAVRGVEKAQRSLAQAYQATATAGGEALQNLKDAMNALSPAGQRFALFIFSLKDEFKQLQAAAESGLLPGVQEGIEKLLPYMEPLRGVIFEIGQTLGSAFVRGVEALKDPVWQEFFSYLGATAGPTLAGMLEVIGNVATGIVGILNGLSGFNGSIGQGILEWSRNFAEFGKTVDQNPGFQKFLAYVREAAPVVLGFFSTLWEFTKRFVAAAAPIGVVVILAFEKMVEWINKIPVDTLTIIIGTIAALSAAFLVVAAVTGIVAAVVGSTVSAVILGVGLLVAALLILYQKVEPFRNFVDAVFGAIATAVSYLWREWLKPTFENISTGVRFVIDVFQWLYDHVFKYIFGAIKIAFDILWAVIQVFFGLWQIAIKVLSIAWQEFYKDKIKPIVDLLKIVFDYLGGVIERNVLPPWRRGLEAMGAAWNLMKEAAKVPIRFVIETILNNGILGAYNKVAKFFKVKPDDVKVDLPQGFAVGGRVTGPGTGTSDSILARLSAGEHVWTAREVRAFGGHTAMEELRAMVRAGWVPGYRDGGAVAGDFIPAFKDGGWLGDVWEKAKSTAKGIVDDVSDFFSDPSGTLRKVFDKLIESMPGRDVEAVQVALGVPRKILDFALEKVKDLFRADDTGNFGPGPGFGAWPSSPGAQRGDSGVWRTVVALIRSTGPVSGSFGNAYRPGDPLWHGSGRAVDWMGYEQDALSTYLALLRPLELIHRTKRRDYAYTRGVNKGSFSNQLMEDHRNHVHVAFDQGGWLEPGMSAVFNGTGRPEPVLTNRQWQSIDAMVKQQRVGGPQTVNQFHFLDTTLTAGKLNAINEAQAAYWRQGRAR